MAEFQVIMKSGEDLQKNLARFGQVIHLCTVVMKKEVDNSSDLKKKGELKRQIENLEIKVLPKIMGRLNEDTRKDCEIAAILQKLEMSRKESEGSPLTANIESARVFFDEEVAEDQEASPSIMIGKLTLSDEKMAQKESEEEINDSQIELSQDLSGSSTDLLANTEQPVLLTPEEAKSSPIRAAAQEILVESSKFSSSNPIIMILNHISANMTDMSKFHKKLLYECTPENKHGFIKAAMDILAEVNKLIAPAKLLADPCTDARIKKQLLASIDTILLTAQQLKIVAAVKASSPSDKDKDSQLVSSAHNLMSAIKNYLRMCESASAHQKTKQSRENLRSKRKTMFKRVSYRP